MESPERLKIAIVGPESTGKSALAQELAWHFNTDWVPEVAREFLENLNRSYTAHDVEQIARLQLEQEDEKWKTNSNLLICDTTLLVIKIWMLNSFGHCPEWILKSIESRSYDLILLTDIDLPWEPDPLREHPDKRLFFRDWYQRELETGGLRWEWVSGLGENRLISALTAIKKNVNL